MIKKYLLVQILFEREIGNWVLQIFSKVLILALGQAFRLAAQGETPVKSKFRYDLQYQSADGSWNSKFHLFTNKRDALACCKQVAEILRNTHNHRVWDRRTQQEVTK